MTLAFPGLCLVIVGFLVAQRFENAGAAALFAGALLILAGAFA